MVLAENIGPGVHETIYDEYFPSLAVLDTEEILERIGPEWQNPGPSSRHNITEMDAILTDWVHFLSEAETGHQIVRDAVEKQIISGNVRDLTSYSILRQALGGKEQYPEIITTIRAAFISLLSQETQSKIAKDYSQVKMDEELREKIDRLVTSVGHQAEAHYASLFQRLAEFEDD